VKIPYIRNANGCEKRSNRNIFTYTQGSGKIFASGWVIVVWNFNNLLKFLRDVAMATKFLHFIAKMAQNRA